VSYYDENRTGTLVSRIMTDVEGVRNLVGTGLVEFVGGMLTACSRFSTCCISAPKSRSPYLPSWAHLSSFLQYAFKRIRPIFRERARSTPK